MSRLKGPAGSSVSGVTPSPTPARPWPPPGKSLDKGDKAVWKQNPAHTKLFLEIMWDSVRMNGKKGTVIKSSQYRDVAIEFFDKTGVYYADIQLKNKYQDLRKEWGAWKFLTSKRNAQTGGGWNSTLGTVEGDEEWWTYVIGVNKECAKFRNGPPDNEELLRQVFSGSIAHGALHHEPTGEWYAQEDVYRPEMPADPNLVDEQGAEDQEFESSNPFNYNVMDGDQEFSERDKGPNTSATASKSVSTGSGSKRSREVSRTPQTRSTRVKNEEGFARMAGVLESIRDSILGGEVERAVSRLDTFSTAGLPIEVIDFARKLCTRVNRFAQSLKAFHSDEHAMAWLSSEFIEYKEDPKGYIREWRGAV